MSDSTKKLIRRIILYALILLLLYVLQATVFPRLRIWGVAPLILPIFVVGIALFDGASWGGGVGLAAGVLCDFAFSGSVVFFTILLTVIGVGLGLASTYLLNRGRLTYMLCVVIALFTIAFLQMFPFLVFDRVTPFALLHVALLQSLYSLLFALPIYYLIPKQ